MSLAQFVIEAHLRQGRSVASIATQHGISRSWIYELLARYQKHGEAGLEPRSRRPKSSPNQIPAEVEDEIVFIRKTLSDEGFDAGAETIRYHLAKKFDHVPSLSTIWRVLKKRGFVQPQPRKRPRSSYIRFEAQLPNECWQSDMTHWKLEDGTDVEILNFIDDHSRFLLCSIVTGTTKASDVVNQFNKTAAKYGYPESVLTDNGLIYTARFKGGKVAFEYELEKLGIKQKHSRPNHPTTQGKIERWHQSLKQYLDKKPAARTIDELQKQIDSFVSYYNEIRPHRSLKRTTPKSVFDSKIKAYPKGIDKVNNFRVRRDRVNKDGTVTLRYNSKLHKILVGKPYKTERVLMLIDDRDIRIITEYGEQLRHFTLDTTRKYQSMNHNEIF